MSVERVKNKLTDNWMRENFINHKDGVFLIKYFYRGNPAPAIYLDTKKVRALRHCKLIDKDLNDAKTWLAEADKLIVKNNKTVNMSPEYNLNETLAKGLMKIAVVNYMKAFLSKSRSFKLNESQLPIKLRASHKEIDSIRNTYVAHGDVSRLEDGHYIWAISPKTKNKNWTRYSEIFEHHHSSAVTLGEVTKELEALIDWAVNKCEARSNWLVSEITKELSLICPRKLYSFIDKNQKITLNDKKLLELQK